MPFSFVTFPDWKSSSPVNSAGSLNLHLRMCLKIVPKGIMHQMNYSVYERVYSQSQTRHHGNVIVDAFQRKFPSVTYEAGKRSVTVSRIRRVTIAAMSVECPRFQQNFFSVDILRVQKGNKMS